MDTIGTTQAADFIPEVWTNRALGMLESELYLAKNVSRDSEYTNARAGDTIHINKRGTLEATQKTSGTANTVQNPSSSKVDVTMQHWYVSFIVEDIVEAQANQAVMDGYIEDAIIVLGEEIEAKLAAQYASFTTNIFGTAATDITDTVLLQARAALSTNRAPRSNRFLYLEPDQVNAVLKLSKFVDASQYGKNDPVQEGELGKIYGMRVFESIHTQSAGSPVTVYNYAMHRNAMVLAMRPLVSPKAALSAVTQRDGLMMRAVYTYDADEMGDRVTLDVLFGVGVPREELGCVIRS